MLFLLSCNVVNARIIITEKEKIKRKFKKNWNLKNFANTAKSIQLIRKQNKIKIVNFGSIV